MPAQRVRRRSLLTAGLAGAALPVATTLGSGATHAGRTPLASYRPYIDRAEPPDLHVMTFNVRLPTPTDGPPHTWPERRPLVRSMLRGESPTIIGTQEGYFGQLDDIMADLPSRYEWIHLFRRGGSVDEATAVLYDRQRVRPVAYDHLWLSDEPRMVGSMTWGNRFPRMLTWVRFVDRETSAEFVCVNTHLDHETEEARVRSAELLVELNAEFDAPTVVIGDFNAAQDTSDTYRILTAGGLDDTWHTADERLTPEYSTFNRWDPEPIVGSRRIDWILTSPEWSTSQFAINTWSHDGLVPSDHWAVQALLTVH